MTDGFVRRRPVDGGEARMIATSGTQRTFEIERGNELFSDAWDPRETGVVFYLVLDRWTKPEGAPMSDADRRVVLDAIWALAPDSGGLSALLEWVATPGIFVARRWRWGDEGFLCRVRTDGFVEYLELDRTLHVPFEREPGLDGRGFRRARVAGSPAARWRYPEPREVDEEEWARVLPRLLRATDANMFDTEPGWAITSSEAEA